MESWEVIKWALGIMGTVIGWLVINNIQQDKTLITIGKTLDNVEKKVDKLSDMLTLFIKNEIDVLKDISKRNS